MPDLFIDLFHYVWILWLGMTLHDLTTLCVNSHVTKLWWANTQSRICSLLVVCCVKMGMTIMSSKSTDESLVAIFGYIKTAQVRWWIEWWHHFSSDLGSLVCAEQLFHCGKKCAYVEEYEGFSLEQLTNIPNVDLCCGCCFHWTITMQVCAEMIGRTWSTFDHVWPQEGPGDEVILASVCNRTQWHWHETMSQSMCFVVGMISASLVSWESSLFRWMCSSLQFPVLKCFFGAKQNPRYTLEM